MQQYTRIMQQNQSQRSPSSMEFMQHAAQKQQAHMAMLMQNVLQASRPCSEAEVQRPFIRAATDNLASGIASQCIWPCSARRGAGANDSARGDCSSGVLADGVVLGDHHSSVQSQMQIPNHAPSAAESSRSEDYQVHFLLIRYEGKRNCTRLTLS